GSYLGRPCPSPPPRALGDQHLPGGFGCPQPAPRAHQLPVAGPGHPAVYGQLSTRRPAHKCPVTLHLRFATESLRPHSTIPQTLRSFLGVLISICSRGHRKKAVMGARTSTTSRSSVSAVDTVTVSVARGQPVLPTTPSYVPNYSTDKTVLRALGESGQGMAKQEEVPTVTGRNEDQRSGPDDTGGARSAFRPLGGSFFVPRPGPLQRDLHAKRAEDRSNRKLQTSCISSCPQRNAITSSYSSTRGFLPVKRRRGPAIPQGLPQKSAKKGSKEGPPSPSAAPVVSQRKSQPDKDAEATRGQKRPWRNGPLTPDGPRPRKRRVPLLPHRRGEPLRLPPAPKLGFRVTNEDLDSEKEAAFRRINSALRGET
ncbi:hypothetical protein DBR06_SOUSAS33510007, partial [Sousa chinensis]